MVAGLYFRGSCGLAICTLAISILSGCESTSPPYPGGFSELQKEEAIKSKIDCMRVKARQLDDGTSDAGTIGQAVALACREESEYAARVFIAGRSKSMQDSFVRQAQQSDAELATLVVLNGRTR